MMSKKDKKKKFARQNSHKHNRVGSSWRRPRGKHSNSRLGKKYGKTLPGVGHRTPKDIRGLHPSGYKDIIVNRPEEVEELDPETDAARIASKVGGRKREKILDKAEEKGVKVLNAGREETGEEEEEEIGEAEEEEEEQ